MPMATAIADVAAARRDYLDESGGRYVHVIADSGMTRSGDIAKALACGADAAMVGSPFARAEQAPGRDDHPAITRIFHFGSPMHLSLGARRTRCVGTDSFLAVPDHFFGAGPPALCPIPQRTAPGDTRLAE